MSERNSKSIEVATFIFTVLNTIIVAIGGYILIGKYEGEMFQSTTALNKIQAEISRIQLNVAESNARLDSLSKNAEITEKTIKLIEAVRPKLDFKIDPKVEHKNEELTITFDLVNYGEFEIWIKPKRFLITKMPYRNNIAKLEDQKSYVLSIDYSEIDTVRSLGAKQNRGHTFTVKLEPNTPKTIFYYMEYSIGTINGVVTLIDTMAQQVGITDTKTLSKEIVYRYGSINL